jgi:uncharacterized protein (TIGR00297 family)
VKSSALKWQSQAILLIVMPVAAAEVLLVSVRWAGTALTVAIWALALSILLGLIAWRLHSASRTGAAASAILTACVMLTTATTPYAPWRTALIPVLAVLVLTAFATRTGRKRKEQLGIAERRTGRVAAQVAANIGAAALLSTRPVQLWMADCGWFSATGWPLSLLYAPMLAALCEAAADTVSSELGQVLDSRPRMITTLRIAQPGTDGAVSPGGTFAGVVAAGIVATAGASALRGGWLLLTVSWVSGIFGLIFDSLLGATLERRGWLNNDAVNFLSTLSAAACALALVALAPRLGLF